MWQFSGPEIVFGEDALTRLGELTAAKAFIVTDENMVKLGHLDRVLEQLNMAGVESGLFTEVEPDPSVDTMQKARAAMTAYQPEVVIGLGGGSCLDTAKVAWFLYERPDILLEEINPFSPFEVSRTQYVAIPTTSGTGADITIGAVLTDSDQQRKIAVYAREMQPTMSIVDPSLVAELPAQVTADTGMDVVSHAVEAFTSPFFNDFADGLSLQAMRLVFDYLPRAYADGADLEAREHMHNAATIAGLAMNNSSIALGHALAHALGAMFSFPHGRIVGLLLPFSMAYTANGGGTRYAEMARALYLPAAGEEEGVNSLITAIRDVARQVDQPLNLHELGIDQTNFEAALPEMAIKAAEDPQMLTTQRMPEHEELEELFRCAYEGRAVDF